jgi:L,D-peptidoglycan transpeptidase YkuD (ErfK/YbiS/YcfS/YnhG family)
LTRSPETPRPGPRDLVLTPLGLRFMGRHFACALGRGGIRRAKREGDGATPAGVHRIVACLYRPGRIARSDLPDWAVPIRPRDRWCDAAGHPDYNHMVRAPFAPSSEALCRADPLYDLILTTDWNWPLAHAGRGSAIFLHIWRRPRFPTAGCVALARADLIWITRRLTYESRLFVPDLHLRARTPAVSV